jgi:hypothetical protein
MADAPKPLSEIITDSSFISIDFFLVQQEDGGPGKHVPETGCHRSQHSTDHQGGYHNSHNYRFNKRAFVFSDPCKY